MDEDLKELLDKWQLPDPSMQLDERIMETYSRHRRSWIFRRTGSVRVPVPVLVLLLLLPIVSAVALVHNSYFLRLPPAPVLSMPVRVVEIPVVKERVVTRLVYPPAKATEDSVRRTFRSAANLESDKEPMDLTGFQPLAEFQINVLKGGNRNEK